MIRKAILMILATLAMPAHALASTDRTVSGWTLHINPSLLNGTNAATTERAVVLLKAQLDEIIRVVPPPAVAKLRKVELWFSPEYPGVRPHAEFHPDAKWLEENGRDPKMAKGVEFTNVLIFDAEVRRMPNFALHELSHAYHDLVIGFNEPRILAAYQHAKASGKYDRVERRDGDGVKRFEKAYAMFDHKEYFAECTEAFFVTNDFFPFTRDELKKQDPEMFALLQQVWKRP
jgi:hypothetical protein